MGGFNGHRSNPSAPVSNRGAQALSLLVIPLCLGLRFALRLGLRGVVLALTSRADALHYGSGKCMQMPRHWLDSGTWGVMGIGIGYAIAAAVETGRPVVAIEGDSAFGFAGMEFETICRYRLPITVVVLNNGGVYRGDEVVGPGTDPAPTVLSPHARHELIAEAFGGRGYHVATPTELRSALTDALASNGLAIVDCELDPAAGVESGHLTSLNPKSAAAAGG